MPDVRSCRISLLPRMLEKKHGETKRLALLSGTRSNHCRAYCAVHSTARAFDKVDVVALPTEGATEPPLVRLRFGTGLAPKYFD
jgi:hypothetical protein